MLPFQKPRRAVGLIINKRKPDGDIQPDGMQDENAGLMACAEDMLRAISAKDSKALADAMHAAFQCMESAPHDEAGEDEGYDAQNMKAAKNE